MTRPACNTLDSDDPQGALARGNRGRGRALRTHRHGGVHLAPEGLLQGRRLSALCRGRGSLACARRAKRCWAFCRFSAPRISFTAFMSIRTRSGLGVGRALVAHLRKETGRPLTLETRHAEQKSDRVLRSDRLGAYDRTGRFRHRRLRRRLGAVSSRLSAHRHWAV